MTIGNTDTRGPTADDWARFESLRQRLLDAIGRDLALDGHCKTYEGEISITTPSYFVERNPGDYEIQHMRAEDERWSIVVHCYVFGDSRHEQLYGATLGDALDKLAAYVISAETGVAEDEAETLTS